MPSIELVIVDESVLDELVRCALADASADEVTPRVTPGERWTPERQTWLQEFHRDRRAGNDGPLAEATWAVAAGGRVAGSVRLRRRSAGIVEIGVWLGRGERGRGTGRRAVELVLDQARVFGARQVVAETTSVNTGAVRLLRSLGFDLGPTDDRDRIVATLGLTDQQSRLRVVGDNHESVAGDG